MPKTKRADTKDAERSTRCEFEGNLDLDQDFTSLPSGQ